MTRRRTLRPDEDEIWQAVARTARPMPGRALRQRPADPEAAPVPLVPPRPDRAEPVQPVTPFRIGERAPAAGTRIDVAPASPGRPSPASLRMDRRAFAALVRGRTAPESRIDLHGLTLAEAQPELVRFVLNAHAAGQRLVLVITGKGRPRDGDGPIPVRPGALRHHVPLWLGQAPLVHVVQQVVEAHLRHGGAGALYVYLRRGG
jgi:DNA-nicking Smr family endonuclease